MLCPADLWNSRVFIRQLKSKLNVINKRSAFERAERETMMQLRKIRE